MTKILMHDAIRPQHSVHFRPYHRLGEVDPRVGVNQRATLELPWKFLKPLMYSP